MSNRDGWKPPFRIDDGAGGMRPATRSQVRSAREHEAARRASEKAKVARAAARKAKPSTPLGPYSPFELTAFERLYELPALNGASERQREFGRQQRALIYFGVVGVLNNADEFTPDEAHKILAAARRVYDSRFWIDRRQNDPADVVADLRARVSGLLD